MEALATTEPRVAEFRASYRSREIGPHYSGPLHFAFTSAAALAAVAIALSRLEHVRPLELVTVPVTFLFANAVEYFGHRGPMHHRRPGLGLLFRRHTEQHHSFFTSRAMGFESSKDFKMVLFPPVMILFFLGAIASPIGFLLFLAVGKNVGSLFVATSVSYFLLYEWLHTAYHFPDGHWVLDIPGIGALRRHHLRHHDPRWMGRYNFNITFPIADRIMGTVAPPSRESSGKAATPRTPGNAGTPRTPGLTPFETKP